MAGPGPAKNAEMDLNLCRVFIDIAEAKSLTRAAERGGMTRSNVSRRLRALETEMGAQLLRRTTRNVELTQAGQLLYRRCLAMMEELQRARDAIHQLRSTVSGEVGVRVPTGFGHFYLKPLILGFCREHPDIRLRLLINDQMADLVASKVDLAVQITSAPLDDLVATRLCDVRWNFVATPACLQALEQSLGRPLRAPADPLAAPPRPARGRARHRRAPGHAGQCGRPCGRGLAVVWRHAQLHRPCAGLARRAEHGRGQG